MVPHRFWWLRISDQPSTKTNLSHGRRQDQNIQLFTWGARKNRHLCSKGGKSYHKESKHAQMRMVRQTQMWRTAWYFCFLSGSGTTTQRDWACMKPARAWMTASTADLRGLPKGEPYHRLPDLCCTLLFHAICDWRQVNKNRTHLPSTKNIWPLKPLKVIK